MEGEQIDLGFGLALTPCPFEEFANQNGMIYWRARWLMERLGYATWASFSNVVNRAIASCARVGCPVHENFVADKVIVEGRLEDDFKLSRFACLLVVNHADIKKPAVEELRVHLAQFTAIVVDALRLERLEVRETLTVGEHAMTQQAVKSGVKADEMGLFKDAGYRGLYNMSLAQLKHRKGLSPSKQLYDHIGITELAANSFRVTQTAERLKNIGRAGLPAAKQVARQVGQEIRETMERSGGVRPEDLPLEEDINKVRRSLKTASRELVEADKPAKKTSKKTAKTAAKTRSKKSSE